MSTDFRRWPLLLLIAALTAGLLGCPDPDPDPDDLSITVQDQDLQFDERDTITVEEATIDADGFAVLFADDDGQPDTEPLGASELIDSGDHEDFEIQLDDPIEDDQTMWAVLHYDDDRGEFERTDKQPPVTDADGQRVLDDFEVTVEEDPPDVMLTIDDQTLPEDEADIITVDMARIDADGFVVIYDEDDGEPDDDIGFEFIEEGTHEDFDVDLDRDVDDGETLWGRLHYDEEGDEFEDEDTHPVVTDADGDPVEDSFVVTVDEDPPDPPEDEPYIDIDDQTLDDLSTIIEVDEVNAIDDGWVTIHDEECDERGDVLGYESVDEGLTSDLDVELDQPAADLDDSADLCAALYVDDNDDFDEDDADFAEDDDGDPVLEDFTVDVEDGTPAARITIDTDTPPAYTLEQVEPTTFEDDFETDNDVLEMVFVEEWRYEIANLDTDDNPLEFLNEEDEALLSQDFDAPLEQVATIDWEERDDNFLFTVSEDFYDDTGVIDEEELDGSDAVGAYHSADQANLFGPVDYRSQ